MQLEAARRESRGARARFGETADHVWHALVPGTYAVKTATIACTGASAEVRRIATDLPDRDITCGRCREQERISHAG